MNRHDGPDTDPRLNDHVTSAESRNLDRLCLTPPRRGREVHTSDLRGCAHPSLDDSRGSAGIGTLRGAEAPLQKTISS